MSVEWKCYDQGSSHYFSSSFSSHVDGWLNLPAVSVAKQRRAHWARAAHLCQSQPHSLQKVHLHTQKDSIPLNLHSPWYLSIMWICMLTCVSTQLVAEHADTINQHFSNKGNTRKEYHLNNIYWPASFTQQWWVLNLTLVKTWISSALTEGNKRKKKANGLRRRRRSVPTISNILSTRREDIPMW